MTARRDAGDENAREIPAGGNFSWQAWITVSNSGVKQTFASARATASGRAPGRGVIVRQSASES
jgi:hypothetical protein